MEKEKLGLLVDIKTGKLNANASDENGKYPFFTCSKETLKINRYSYDCECVLVAGNGDLNAKYYNGKFDAYQRTYILTNKNNKRLNLKYLYYFMQRYLEILRTQSIGGVIKYIKLENLSDAEIKIVSLDEQEKIINKLQKIESIIDIRKQQLEKLQILVKSQFVEMFGDIKNDNFRCVPIKKLVDTNISKVKKKYTSDDIIKYIDISSIDNVKNEIIGYTKYNIGNEPSRAQQCLIKGDILISTVRPNLKNIAVNNFNDDNVVGSSGFCVLRPKGCKVDYLLEVLKSEKFTNDMVAVTTGSNYPAIHSTDILNYEISVPPMELQNKFADIVKQIDKQKFEIKRSLTEMEDLYNSLMNEYFG